jgi:hypothetical protein
MKDEALKMALEALKFCKDLSLSMKEIERTEEAIAVCKQALAAQPAPDMQRHNDYMAGFNEGYDRAEKNARNTTPPAAQPAPVQPVWIQPDHLQKAQKAPFLCRVEPHKRDDFVPLYPTPPSAPVPLTDEQIDAEFEVFASKFDHESNEWLDMGVDEYFRAGFRAAAPAAQPAVPDAIHHTDLSEHPQYIEGWNDCRAEMLKGMKP